MTVTAHMVEESVELDTVIITDPLSSEMMLVSIDIQIETIQMMAVIRLDLPPQGFPMILMTSIICHRRTPMSGLLSPKLFEVERGMA
jgi:hypothetical protein